MIVGIPLPTRDAGTAAKEIFVPTVIDRTVVPVMHCLNGILLEILRLGVRYAQKSVGDRIKKSHPIWKNTTPDVA